MEESSSRGYRYARAPPGSRGGGGIENGGFWVLWKIKVYINNNFWMPYLFQFYSDPAPTPKIWGGHIKNPRFLKTVEYH